MLRGVGDLDESSNVPHAERSSKGTEHEKLGASETVNQPEEPDEGKHRLDNAEDACSQETSVGTSDTKTLEDGG